MFLSSRKWSGMMRQSSYYNGPQSKLGPRSQLTYLSTLMVQQDRSTSQRLMNTNTVLRGLLPYGGSKEKAGNCWPMTVAMSKRKQSPPSGQEPTSWLQLKVRELHSLPQLSVYCEVDYEDRYTSALMLWRLATVEQVFGQLLRTAKMGPYWDPSSKLCKTYSLLLRNSTTWRLIKVNRSMSLSTPWLTMPMWPTNKTQRRTLIWGQSWQEQDQRASNGSYYGAVHRVVRPFPPLTRTDSPGAKQPINQIPR